MNAEFILTWVNKKESVDKLNAGFNLSCNHIAVFKIMFTSIEKDGLDVFSE